MVTTNARRSITVALLLILAIGGLVIGAFALGNSRSDDASPTTSALYHTQFDEDLASPPATGHSLPVPGAQDSASAGAMSVSGNAMIEAANGMDAVAPTMIASGDPALVELGQHWERDAQALRERGAWMVVSATSDSMVHDPERAQQVNLYNLQGNGMVMAEEGRAMVEHGQDMISRVTQMKEDGTLSADVADGLIAEGQKLVAAGEALEEDGTTMQRTAENLLRSIGR